MQSLAPTMNHDLANQIILLPVRHTVLRYIYKKLSSKQFELGFLRPLFFVIFLDPKIPFAWTNLQFSLLIIVYNIAWSET